MATLRDTKHPEVREHRDLWLVDTRYASLHAPLMRLLVGLVIALSACTQSADGPETSVHEAPFDPLPLQPAPAINWNDWGHACDARIVGSRSCLALDGMTLGWCKRVPYAPDPDGDAIYAGQCLPACNAQPPYLTRCPADGTPTDNWGDTHGQGCHCERL